MGTKRTLWKIRPKSERGTATSDELYRAIGMALTSWEYVETQLATVFALLVGAREISPPKEPAVRAYGTIVSYRSRRDMLMAAAEGRFQLSEKDAADPKVSRYFAELQEKLDRLIREADNLAKLRNNIAHGIVGHNIGRGHYLMPPLYATKKYPASKIPSKIWDRATYALTAADIIYYREQFDTLYDKLSELAEDLRL